VEQDAAAARVEPDVEAPDESAVKRDANSSAPDANEVATSDVAAVATDRDVTQATNGEGAEVAVSPLAAVAGEPKLAEAPARTAVPGERGPPSVVTPLPELCREACANAHRLVLAELPIDTAKAMREEVQRALERECPGRCLQRASLASARCIATAKSALELAACQ